jgi:lia operon protein LiaG
MSRISKLALVTAIVAAAAIAGAAISYFRSGITRQGSGNYTLARVDDEKSFDSRDLSAVHIATGSTDVHTRTAPGSSLTARLHGSVGSDRPEHMPRLFTERRGGVLEIRIERPRRIGLFLGDLVGRLTFDLTLPEDYHQTLTVESGSGDVSLSSHRLELLSLSTGSGDINLESVACASLTTSSGSGDQTARELSSDEARLESASGDIRIAAYRGGAEISTGSGDVRLQFQELAGNVSADTGSGDVVLILPESADFRLEARSASGDISNAFPLQPGTLSREGGRKSLGGSLGSGAYLISVRTASGDIKLTP